MSISDTTHDIVESQGIRISTVKGAVTVADELPIIVISTAVYIKNPDTKEPKTHADVGDLIEFNATFSDPSLNIERVEISIVDRDGKHKLNAALSVVSGYGEGSFIVTEPIDYCLTNAAINHHREKINAELVLDKEHVIRVS